MHIGEIRTDPARLDSYTESLQAQQNLLGAGQWWRFRHFRKTEGYANMPLDGVWCVLLTSTMGRCQRYMIYSTSRATGRIWRAWNHGRPGNRAPLKMTQRRSML